MKSNLVPINVFGIAMSIPDEFIKGSHVRRDWVDLRDQSYSPSLSVLSDVMSLDPRLMVDIPSSNLKQPIFGVRDQKATQRCVGYALAALIDIQRSLQWLRSFGGKAPTAAEVDRIRLDIASADMLYRMAFFHDHYPDLSTIQGIEGIRSLRSAIKGFYHHGACLDWPKDTRPSEKGRWQSTSFLPTSPDDEGLFPNVDQAKDARRIGLGAYFRLASVLNHYHAALNDAQAVLCTANIHDGWTRATPDNRGIIAWPPQLGRTGSHAVVLTGYDETGFHVLNSWGAAWGGYKGQAGIGLWDYGDWAQNVIDAWVLRLGVSAPKAFGFLQGERGVKGLSGPVQAGSTPCYELVGHYMHLDDGFHVSSGSYPSFPSSWKRTRNYLLTGVRPGTDPPDPGDTRYRGLLLWIPGSLEGIKATFTQAVARKNRIKGHGLYPYTVFWCNSFVEKSLEVFNIIFESCKSQAGVEAEHLNSLIEERVQGVGRAFWREMEMSAQRAVHGTTDGPSEVHAEAELETVELGYVADLLRGVMELKAELGCEVHLVAEGTGALVVHEMLAAIRRDADRDGASRQYFCNHDPTTLFDSLHLVHPAIGWARAQVFLVPLVQRINETAAPLPHPGDTAPGVEPVSEVKADRPARIYVPSEELEAQLCFGAYGKSLLHLAASAFEDRLPGPGSTPELPTWVPQDFLGMAGMDRKRSLHSALYRLNRLASQKRPGDRVTQTELISDQAIQESIFAAIASMRDPACQTFGGGKVGQDHG
ncbi:C1 family peptidase [Microbaculum marinum]|uniref:C1 family peptidase n=1 Tax=Microbaculum marinum TaxID=1764581 RepID=A0AAW9RV35_9HYPH